MKTRTKIIISIIIFFILLITYIIFDYTNFLGNISFNIKMINADFFSIFITNLIVILLYLITYFIVDQKNTKERKNKKELIKYLLESDYKTCLNYLNILEDKQQLEILIQNINSKNTALHENEYFNKWMEASFKNYNEIMKYSNQGLIEINIFKKYLTIKSDYSFLMTGYVLSEETPHKIREALKEGHQNLKTTIEQELDILNNYNCED